MRYAIISDIHSNFEAFEAALVVLKSEGIDKYLCIGDIVGYGVDIDRCIELLHSLDFISVAGNHDWASAGKFALENFNTMAKEAILYTREKINEEDLDFLSGLKLTFEEDNFILVHGSLVDPENFNYIIDGYSAQESFLQLKKQICFIGHSHVNEIYILLPDGRVIHSSDKQIILNNKNNYIVNVGSIGQPRDGNPLSCFCIYDSSKRQVSFVREKYDVKATRDKIIKAGLPLFLGDRLVNGQ